MVCQEGNNIINNYYLRLASNVDVERHKTTIVGLPDNKNLLEAIVFLHKGNDARNEIAVA